MLKEINPHLLLRIGAAFAFLYPPLVALKDPVSWMSYAPDFLRSLPLLHGFGLIEVLLALWVLFGSKVRIPAFLMTAILLLIVVTNASEFQVLFRDLSIATMTLALALFPEKTKTLADGY